MNKIRGQAVRTPNDRTSSPSPQRSERKPDRLQGVGLHYDAQNRLRLAPTTECDGHLYYDGKNADCAQLNGTIRFSVWDGWERLEEWAKRNPQRGYLRGIG